ncbi:MAG: adenosine kinase [Thiotrichaceae bacterium]|nr:adenosine kinase [Thiotrichaceae bacterium]
MKYHVYGIGNALVDKEFEVTEEFLATQGIEKGMMTLLDDEAHITLLDTLKKTFGLKARSGGGSAANSIVAVSQFGGNTFYACKVADDEQGQFYAKNLKESGVSTKLTNASTEGSTGKCMVMITPDAERTMNTFLGITADFSESELHFEELAQSEYLYIEGYLVTSDISRAAAIKARQVAKENKVKTAMTFSDPSMVTYFKDGLKEMFAEGVDILFCNEEEALTFTDTTTLDDAITQLSPKVGKLVITQGAEGASIVYQGKTTKIAGQVATAVDTNGAGDMFAGAFLYGVTHGLSDEQSADLANRAAAKVVATFGARLSKATHDSLLAEVS